MATRLRIARNVLRIGDPIRSLAFYTGPLGMTLVDQDEAAGETVFRLGYPAGAASSPAPAELELRYRAEPMGTPPGGSTSYWKVGITVADVDVARTCAQKAGVAVSAPRQFEDIGYLCHLADPDGHAIELLQHRFAAYHRPVPSRGDLALGSEPTLAHITLRVRDAEAALRFYTERVGLTLMSRQPVPRHRFTLYFLSTFADPPPSPDLEAVENREWLWQRPYTMLELQHRWDDADNDWASRNDATPGFDGIVVETDEGASDTLRDPDGNRVALIAPSS